MPVFDTDTIIELLNLFLTFFYGVGFTVLFLDLLTSRRDRFILSIYCVLSLGAQLAVFFTCSTSLVYQIYPLLVHLPLVLVLVLCCRRKVFPTLVALLMSYFLTIPRFFFATILMMCFPSFVTTISFGRVLVTIPLSILFYYISVSPIRAALKRPYKDLYAFVLILLLSYILPYITTEYTDWLTEYPSLIVGGVIILFFVFVVYLFHLYFGSYDDSLELQQRNQLLSVSAHALEKQMTNLKNMQEETRILRHDIRHFASIIDGYAKEANVDAILSHTASLTSRVGEITPVTYCSNETVNLLLGYYLEPFTARQIPVNYHIRFPAELYISDIDICIILANALENAYNAMNDITKESFVNLKITSTADQLFIKVENRCHSNITFQNELPISSQKDHGIGTRSIVCIARKYSGIYSFSERSGVFTMQVILHNHILQ